MTIRQAIAVVHHALIEPRLLTEDERRREYILNIILLGSIVLLWLLDGSIVYYMLREGAGYSGVSFEAFSLLPVFFMILLALSRRGFVMPASYALIAAYLVSNSYAAYLWGADLQVVVLIYALIILMASILVSTRFGFFIAAAIGAYIIPLWYAQFHEFFDTLDQKPSMSDGIIFVLIYFLIMIIAWLSNREIENSLRRARMSERALKEQKEGLEVTVEERTRELREAQFEKVAGIHRFAEFGQLASGLFHDLINLLMVIMPDAPKNADILRGRVNDFVEGMRRELQHEATQEFFSMNESVERAVQLLSYKARRANVRVGFNPGEDILAYGYPFRFHHMVVNLLSNAIESYGTMERKSAKERDVHIALVARDGRVLLSVRDSGAGIPAYLHEKIFEPFFSTKQGEEGIGIGLSLVKKMAEENFDGTIAVHSAPGEGSTFIVSFPLPQKL